MNLPDVGAIDPAGVLWSKWVEDPATGSHRCEALDLLSKQRNTAVCVIFDHELNDAQTLYGSIEPLTVSRTKQTVLGLIYRRAPQWR